MERLDMQHKHIHSLIARYCNEEDWTAIPEKESAEVFVLPHPGFISCE